MAGSKLPVRDGLLGRMVRPLLLSALTLFEQQFIIAFDKRQ